MLGDWQREFERALQAVTQAVAVEKGGLGSVVEYCLFPGGKRIRPLLIFALLADFCAAPSERALRSACAVEFLHAASLIHDDLPCMDNDDFRRGRPSCHRAFNEASALLAGDFMVAYAFKLIAEGATDSSAVREIAELSSAFSKLCIGQHLDMFPEKQSDGGRTILLFKTAALFRACTAIVASQLNLDAARSALMTQLGEEIGIVFQVVDDYVDRFGSFETRGRPLSSDERNGKQTLFAGDKESGLAQLRTDLEKLRRTLLELERCSDRRLEKTREIIDRIIERAGDLKIGE